MKLSQMMDIYLNYLEFIILHYIKKSLQLFFCNTAYFQALILGLQIKINLLLINSLKLALIFGLEIIEEIDIAENILVLTQIKIQRLSLITVFMSLEYMICQLKSILFYNKQVKTKYHILGIHKALHKCFLLWFLIMET